MGGTGRGFRRNSDSGPDGARASQGTGTRKMGGGSWPLGRLGATPSQAWPWPPSASLSLFPTHLRPQEGGPGSPGQSSGRANRTAGKQGKVAEPLPPSLHAPPSPGRAELGQEFGAEVRKPWKGITSGWWKWRTGGGQTPELCPLRRPKERCLGGEGATEGRVGSREGHLKE